MTSSPKPETDEMNEVEAAPVPDDKHVWVQPRVVRPTKPKKAPAVSYMSECGSALPAGCLCWGSGGGRGRPERSPAQQTLGHSRGV